MFSEGKKLSALVSLSGYDVQLTWLTKPGSLGKFGEWEQVSKPLSYSYPSLILLKDVILTWGLLETLIWLMELIRIRSKIKALIYN